MTPRIKEKDSEAQSRLQRRPAGNAPPQSLEEEKAPEKAKASTSTRPQGQYQYVRKGNESVCATLLWSTTARGQKQKTDAERTIRKDQRKSEWTRRARTEKKRRDRDCVTQYSNGVETR